MSDRLRTFLLFFGWAICFAVGLTSAGILGAGVLRDTHFGQAELVVDLGSEQPWRGTDFRVWGGGDFVLWLTTLRPQPPFEPGDPFSSMAAVSPVHFTGELEVRVLAPDGTTSAEWTHGGDPPHVAGGGSTWTRLGGIELRDLPLHPWRLEARTTLATPALSADGELASRLLLRPDRPDVGMGGLINYAMIVPATLFLFLAFALGVALARSSGHRWPAWVSGVALLVFVALLAAR